MKHTVKRIWCLFFLLCLICSVIPVGVIVNAVDTEPASEYHHATDLSTGVENIVKRAEQMLNIKWTPQKNIVGWGGSVTYQAGVTYTGLPYGRPVDGDYVPWETDLMGFIEMVNDPNSKMYTSSSNNGGWAPYYSLDCSAFVSWAWGLDSRQYTYNLPDYATVISDTSYENMEVGDCLNRSGWHVVLVTDIVHDGFGKIVAVEISESDGDAPGSLCRSIWFGQGYSRSMSDFQETYLDDGYILYRSKTRDSVTYTHSCASPLPGDSCSCMEAFCLSNSHDLVKQDGKAPTCVDDGSVTYWICAACGGFYADADAVDKIDVAEIVVKATGHSFVNYVSDGNATREADGTETAVCENCDATDTRIEEGSRKEFRFALPLAVAMIAVLAALGFVVWRNRIRRRRRRRRRNHNRRHRVQSNGSQLREPRQ